MNPLQVYKDKRKGHTPEPKALAKPKPSIKKNTDLIFVIQKHHARRLHYDLRLELNGVLKSWAVPKEPSLNPEDKRLAIMVEDHPFDYRNFEGIIPKGNYGAGLVEIWDQGTYRASEESDRKETEKRIRAGLEKGHIDFTLQGSKLKGSFALIQLKNAEKGNEWLLIKRKDSYASSSSSTTSSTITPETAQKASNKSIKQEEIPTKNASTLPNFKIAKIKKSPLPKSIKPMLGYLVKEPFDREGWIFEVKWDGYRAIAEIEQDNITIYSRNGLLFNPAFPEIMADLKKMHLSSAVLDGELVILDDKGKSHFQEMQNFQRTQHGNVFYYVFDLIYWDGKDLRHLPLIERKKILSSILPKDTRIRYSDHVETIGISFFQLAEKNQLEGIMGKNAQSTYQMKRSRDWVKIKTNLRQEVVIGGFTKPRGSRKKFGSLLIGFYEQNHLKYAGHVGTGFTQQSLRDIHEMMTPLIQSTSPFIVSV